MEVLDYRVSGGLADIHLQEKGGVVNRVPVHHKLREYLDEYIEAAPGRKDDLSEKPMSRHDALQVVKRRCATANLPVDICCHSFRGSGITLYLQKGGNLEHAQKIAGHADPRTTRLYDRTGDTVSLDEVERIVF